MNLCSHNSPYSLNCHVGAMLVFRMLCRIIQSSDAHRTKSVSVMDHEQTTGVSFRIVYVLGDGGARNFIRGDCGLGGLGV